MRHRLIYSMKKRPFTCTFFTLCQLILVILVYKGYINPFHNVNYDHPNHEDWSARIFQEHSHKFGYKIDLHQGNQISNLKVHSHVKNELIDIAIGVAVTSKGTNNITLQNLRYRFPFFRTLLPSFCKTSTQGYNYHFYVAYDSEDNFFTTEVYQQWFTDTFYSFKETMCNYVTELKLHFVECNHNRKPAWAQNDAMMEAYLDHMEYYYRVNDDTLLQSPGWTELFIKQLSNLQPPNIGVVGPRHYSGNLEILTYDFVHRNHIDIFGFYYPRLFTDWFADDWITSVYEPNRTIKLSQVKVMHTQMLGTRYLNQFGLVQYLKQQITIDKETLNTYLKHNRENRVDNSYKSTKQNAISLSLPEKTSDFVYGIMRNIHLAKLYFPEWQVYIFVKKGLLDFNDRLYVKLKLLKAHIEIISDIKVIETIPASMFNNLVVDQKNIEHFLVRSALGRLSHRDAESVKAWQTHTKGFYCVRDHPSHANQPIVSDLWGGQTDIFLSNLGKPIKYFLTSYFTALPNRTDDLQAESKFLQDIMWPKVKHISYCHSTVACDIWSNTYKFPVERQKYDYSGKKYTAFGIPLNTTDNAKEALMLLKDNVCL